MQPIVAFIEDACPVPIGTEWTDRWARPRAFVYLSFSLLCQSERGWVLKQIPALEQLAEGKAHRLILYVAPFPFDGLPEVCWVQSGTGSQISGAEDGENPLPLGSHDLAYLCPFDHRTRLKHAARLARIQVRASISTRDARL
jgi:hypothetical protein